MFSNMENFEHSMPDDLILSEAISQIQGKNEVYISKNFIEIFETKYLTLISNRDNGNDEDLNDPDIFDTLQSNKNSFYTAILVELKNSAGIMLDTKGYDNVVPSIQSIYDMFIVRRHENLVEFIISYILLNKSSLAAQFNDTVTNMTVKVARKSFRNKIDATIAVHCSEIVQMILENDDVIHPENMIKVLYMSSPEDYQYLQANSLYDVCALAFNVDTFVNNLRRIYNDAVNLSYLTTNVIERLSELFVNINSESN